VSRDTLAINVPIAILWKGTVNDLEAKCCTYAYHLSLPAFAHKHNRSTRIRASSAKNISFVREGCSECFYSKKKTKLRERTTPTDRPPLVSQVSANFCG
jgi:hypothetical protein